jgi:hypothetical protein
LESLREETKCKMTNIKNKKPNIVITFTILN